MGYTQKSVGRQTMGPEKGKFILDMSRVERPQPKKVPSRRERLQKEQLGLQELHGIVQATDDLAAAVADGRFEAKPYVESETVNSTMNPFNSSVSNFHTTLSSSKS